MALIRVYESRDGDCIALRDGAQTFLIFDTGRRTSSTGSRSGFQRALENAVGNRSNRRRRGKPPVVVVSHVDGDHIHGLMNWVESILKNSSTWTEASQLARSKILEVWCNVPQEDIAFRAARTGQWGEIQPRYRGHDVSPTPRMEPNLSEVAPVYRDKEAVPPNDYNIDDAWLQDGANGELGRSSEKRKAEQFIQQQESIREILERLFGNGEGEQDFTERRIERNRQLDQDEESLLGHMISVAKVMKSIFIEGLSVLDVNIDVDNSRREIFVRWVNGSLRVWSYPPYLELSVGINVQKNDRMWLQLTSEYHRHFRRFYDAGFSVHCRRGGASGFNEWAKLAANARTPMDIITRMLRLAEEHCPGGSQAGISTARAILGLQPVTEQKRRMNLFACLRRLGIPIRGLREYLHAGSPPLSANDLQVRVVSPSEAQIAALERNWQDLQRGLNVKVPVMAREALALSFLASRSSWSEDRSVSNLSSIGLFVPRFGKRSAVTLTGDSRHEEVMASMATHFDKVAKVSERRNLYYQAPHHGSRQNTNVNQDRHPRDVLPSSWKMHTVFVAGGVTGLKGRPHQEVIRFFKDGAMRIVPVRRSLQGTARHFKDFTRL